MSYNQDFRISLWSEFKGPITLVAIAAFIMIGLNNTFYTSFSVDSKKVSIKWNVPAHQIHHPEIQNTLVAESNPVVISNSQQMPIRKSEQVSAQGEVNEEVVAEPEHKNEYAIITEDISVAAAEFYHPKLTTVLSGNAVSGYLEVQGGEVKGLSVNINSDKSKDMGIQNISMGESELQGNIFIYEIDGQNYTGTIYPTSPNEYMVSFVNGPWNGARVKFATQDSSSPSPQVDEPIYNDDSYSAPETDMTNREWASSEVESPQN